MYSNQSNKLWSAPVIVSSLGYFVDIYDILIFNIVRVKSILELNGQNHSHEIADSASVLNYQMVGMLLGGILWGILGDKKGRIKILLGSILVYSLANFATAYIQTIDQYKWMRFISGIGLAGELGAGITLVSEHLPKKLRGIGTSIIAGSGILGCVLVYFVYNHVTMNNWRLTYQIGGILGIVLLLLRIKLNESHHYEVLKSQPHIPKGNFFQFFVSFSRFKKYLFGILIGFPAWFTIGILINYSNKIAIAHNETSTSVNPGKCVMICYLFLAIGDFLMGFICRWLKSRKKALFLYYVANIICIGLFLSPFNNSADKTYFLSGLLGLTTGFWAIFITMAAEQFGTNLRATAAITIPNMVRGSIYLFNFLFITLFQQTYHYNFIPSIVYTGIIVYAITLVAFIFIKETYHKDLNYIEYTSKGVHYEEKLDLT